MIIKVKKLCFHIQLVMFSFYVPRVGIIAGTLNIEDNIHAKCGGVFRYSSKFYHILLYNTPVLAKISKIFKIFHQCIKIFEVISPPFLTDKRDWLVQEQTALGKDISNPLMACNLPKIVWFLNSPYPIKQMSWLTHKIMACGKGRGKTIIGNQLTKMLTIPSRVGQSRSKRLLVKTNQIR